MGQAVSPAHSRLKAGCTVKSLALVESRMWGKMASCCRLVIGLYEFSSPFMGRHGPKAHADSQDWLPHEIAKAPRRHVRKGGVQPRRTVNHIMRASIGGTVARGSSRRSASVRDPTHGVSLNSDVRRLNPPQAGQRYHGNKPATLRIGAYFLKYASECPDPQRTQTLIQTSAGSAPAEFPNRPAPLPNRNDQP